MKNLHELFPDFNFDIDEDLFHDASQDADYFDCSFKETGKMAFGGALALTEFVRKTQLSIIVFELPFMKTCRSSNIVF